MEPTTDWIARLAAAPAGCSHYASVLDEILQAEPGHPDALVMAGLASVAALVFDADSPRSPLRPAFMAAGPAPEDLRDETLDAIKAVAPTVPVDLRARIRDVLWIVRRGAELESARLLVTDYCDAADALGAVGAHDNDHPLPRLRRALRVAASMKWKEGVEIARDRVRGILTTETQRPDIRVNAAELALEWGEDDARAAAGITERLAEAMLAGVDATPVAWDWPRYALEVAASAAERVADRDGARRLRERRAEVYLVQERWLEAHTKAAAGVRVMVLQQGLTAYRDAGASRASVDAAHARLLAVQRELSSELTHQVGPKIDLTDIANQAVARVRGRPFAEALVRLVSVAPPTSVASLRERAVENRRKFPLGFLFQSVRLDREGRTIATRPGGTDDDNAEALTAQMVEHARIGQQMLSRAAINPAREQIAAEHPGARHDWIQFLRDRPLVQRSRIVTLATGLAAGLAGDMIASASILAPQLEHLIRVLVRSRGGITSVFESGDHTQREAALGTMLERPELAEVLDEDLVFDLRSLLDDPSGANLRNRIAHGLCEDDELMSFDALYLWFSTLRLIVLVGTADERVAQPTEGDV